jgi:hypothetical protein
MAYTDIDDPSAYFQTALYTGNAGTQTITNDGNSDLQPDFLWFKERSVSGNHQLINTVSGINKKLMSNSTSGEATQTNYVTAIGSDSFSIGNNNGLNQNSVTNVCWQWKAGTSFSNDASSTSVGSLDSAGSVSTDAGFSIISYTGAGDGQASSTQTVAHGLGVVPQVLIVKNLADATNWFVYHHKNTSTPATDVLYLNLTNATGDDNGPWNDVAPTSSVFTVGGDNGTNGNGDGMIAYCFAEKQGYSKFGSYTGNGNADGTFVYTGFKPAMVICKKSSAAGTNWGIIDNKRANSFNQISAMLNPNSNGTEGANNNCDFVSNGFKWRTSDGNSNASATYIYMAFAENPFVTSTGIPATAR